MTAQSSHRPSEPVADDIAAYFRACRAEVDRTLEELLPIRQDAPPLLIDAMRYSVFAGGKRLRPALSLAAADSTTVMPRADIRRLVLPAACAIEMIHTYSLIHDDLPSMDDDTLRRGRPTAHVVYGEGLAVLAGDGLLTEAFRILAHHPEMRDGQHAHTVTPTMSRRLRVIERVATGAGAGGMVGGQVIDLAASGKVQTPDNNTAGAALDAEDLRRMHEKKTGALIRASAVSGSILVGASDATVDAVDEYARHIGLSFQIVDDILDVEGAADELGKTAGKDAAAGKPTYPALFGVDASRRMAQDAIERAHATLREAGLSGPLGAIADWVLGRTH